MRQTQNQGVKLTKPALLLLYQTARCCETYSPTDAMTSQAIWVHEVLWDSPSKSRLHKVRCHHHPTLGPTCQHEIWVRSTRSSSPLPPSSHLHTLPLSLVSLSRHEERQWNIWRDEDEIKMTKWILRKIICKSTWRIHRKLGHYHFISFPFNFGWAQEMPLFQPYPKIINDNPPLSLSIDSWGAWWTSPCQQQQQHHHQEIYILILYLIIIIFITISTHVSLSHM